MLHPCPRIRQQLFDHSCLDAFLTDPRHFQEVLEYFQRYGGDVELQLAFTERPQGVPPECPWVSPFAAAAISGNARCIEVRSRQRAVLGAMLAQWCAVRGRVRQGRPRGAAWSSRSAPSARPPPVKRSASCPLRAAPGGLLQELAAGR